jgi:hypothetical protein
MWLVCCSLTNMNVASKIQTVLLFYFAQVLFEVGSECACVNVGVGVGVRVCVACCVRERELS